MTPSDTRSTLEAIQRIFVKRFAPDHIDALRSQIERYPLDYAQADAVLKQTWATEGKFCNPGKMLKALRRAAYGDDERKSPKARDKDRQRSEDAEKDRQAAIDDLATVAWVESLDQDDLEALTDYIARTCTPLWKAMLGVPGGKITKQHALERPALRGLLHAAERKLRSLQN